MKPPNSGSLFEPDSHAPRAPDLLILSLAGACMLAWTWGKWPDVLVDFGQQLYLPWQISEGKVLYRDLAYFEGPLSQYFNACLFRLGGASLRTLVAGNLVLLVLLAAMLHRALSAIANRFAATAAVLCFLLLFAFGQFMRYGNFNYVCPYTHEATHGLLLSMAALACLWQLPRRRKVFLALGGLALGGAFLTKAEIFLAGATASFGALFLYYWATRPPAGEMAIESVLFLGMFSFPIAAAYLALSASMSPSQAWAGTLGSWTAVGNAGVRGLKFFRHGMGTDDLPANLAKLLFRGGETAAALAPAALAGFLPLGRRAERRWAAAVFVVVAGFLLVRSDAVDWLESARPFPLLLLIALVWRGWIFFRRSSGNRHRQMREITLLLLALALTGKMLLNCRIQHYGFVLAMPATLLVVVLLLDWIPEYLRTRGARPMIFQAAILAFLAGGTGFFLRVQSHWLARRTVRVGRGPDAFWADERGLVVNDALRFLADRTTPEQTLAVLPEGSMVNFLSRRVTPALFTNYMPTEEMLFGEGALLGAMERNPPDFIALVHKDTTEFGYRFFGVDFARSAGAWIRANYRVAAVFGAPALESDRFGISLLVKKS